VKRDIELVRAVLLKVEGFDSPLGSTLHVYPSEPELEIDGYDGDQVAYHLNLLIDAGFVEGARTVDNQFLIEGLTWNGQEFLARAAGIETKLGNHSFRATGITANLKNGGTLEKAAAMANHASTRTTQLYYRRRDEVSLDEVERIVIYGRLFSARYPPFAGQRLNRWSRPQKRPS
jgi:hypothetical protein